MAKAGQAFRQIIGQRTLGIACSRTKTPAAAHFSTTPKRHPLRQSSTSKQRGERHDVEFVSNVYDEDGRSVIQCNIRDIAERKRIENELRRAKEELAAYVVAVETLVNERTSAIRETGGALRMTCKTADAPIPFRP
jgi:hypothetical protein